MYKLPPILVKESNPDRLVSISFPKLELAAPISQIPSNSYKGIQTIQTH